MIVGALAVEVFWSLVKVKYKGLVVVSALSASTVEVSRLFDGSNTHTHTPAKHSVKKQAQNVLWEQIVAV